MSDANNNAASSGGIGIFGLMFIVLFIGKIFEIGTVATWSWWWVTAPLWGPTATIFFVALCVLTFAVAVKGTAHVLESLDRAFRKR